MLLFVFERGCWFSWLLHSWSKGLGRKPTYSEVTRTEMSHFLWNKRVLIIASLRLIPRVGSIFDSFTASTCPYSTTSGSIPVCLVGSCLVCVRSSLIFMTGWDSTVWMYILSIHSISDGKIVTSFLVLGVTGVLF